MLACCVVYFFVLVLDSPVESIVSLCICFLPVLLVFDSLPPPLTIFVFGLGFASLGLSPRVWSRAVLGRVQ